MNAAAPATAKQASYAKSLAAERAPQAITAPIQSILTALAAGTATAGQASWCIESLLKLPKAPQAAPSGQKADKGYYMHKGSVYVVVASKENPDRTYAKRLELPQGGATKGRWVYAPGMLHTLSWADKMTQEQARAFGKLHGVCAICGATLTDPKSVELGIGPVCLKKVG